MNAFEIDVMSEGHIRRSLISHGRYLETFSEMKIKDTDIRSNF